MLEGMGMDLVDVNCGCPAQKITSSGAGARLLSSPETAGKIFREVCRAVTKIPVTVKIRKGFLDPSGREAVRLAELAQDAGVSAVTVHGRLRGQSYCEKSDWSLIGQIKQRLRIPVFGNGDVFSGTDAKNLMDLTGCDAVMIGRGGLGNPWIYREIDDFLAGRKTGGTPGFRVRADTALRHFEHEIAWEGERRAVLKFRHIADWYLKGAPGVRQLRHRINGLETPAAMKETIAEFCARLP